MRVDSKLVCYVPHKELPLAYRRFLFFLLRLCGDVLVPLTIFPVATDRAS